MMRMDAERIPKMILGNAGKSGEKKKSGETKGKMAKSDVQRNAEKQGVMD
jgi:hypothetical protein